MALRTWPWLRSLQPQIAFSLFGLTSAAPPTVLIRICSTSPVQEPQELAALVCFFHLVHREQPVLLDRLDDGALAHPVAAADFHVVRHGHGLALALMAGIADGALA